MRHASLFSGIGGPEVAAAMLGWENVFHCEINEFGRKVLEYWFPNSESYEDITKTDFRNEYRNKNNADTFTTIQSASNIFLGKLLSFSRSRPVIYVVTMQRINPAANRTSLER